MRNKKTFTILLVVMVLTVVLVPTLAFADSDQPINGEITISSNNAPTIDAFTVSNLTLMQPTNTCSVSMTISELDGWANLEQIMLLFWWSDTSGDPTDLPTFNRDDSTDSDVLYWVEVEDDFAVFHQDDSSTSWLSTTPVKTEVTADTTYTFTFDVTVGKEAREVATASDTNKWQVALKVTDDTGNTDFEFPSGLTPPIQIPNQWYGDLTIETGSGPQWNAATPGMAYADEAAQVFDDTYFCRVVSNGDYKLKARTATTWSTTETTPKSITYDTTIDAANEFSIAVDTTPTYNVGTAVELPNDGGTNPGYTEIVDIVSSDASWGTATGYNYVAVTNIYMFLQTNGTMTTDEANPYTGEIIIGIYDDAA